MMLHFFFNIIFIGFLIAFQPIQLRPILSSCIAALWFRFVLITIIHLKIQSYRIKKVKKKLNRIFWHLRINREIPSTSTFNQRSEKLHERIIAWSFAWTPSWTDGPRYVILGFISQHWTVLLFFIYSSNLRNGCSNVHACNLFWN